MLVLGRLPVLGWLTLPYTERESQIRPRGAEMEFPRDFHKCHLVPITKCHVALSFKKKI